MGLTTLFLINTIGTKASYANILSVAWGTCHPFILFCNPISCIVYVADTNNPELFD